MMLSVLAKQKALGMPNWPLENVNSLVFESPSGFMIAIGEEPDSPNLPSYHPQIWVLSPNENQQG